MSEDKKRDENQFSIGAYLDDISDAYGIVTGGNRTIDKSTDAKYFIERPEEYLETEDIKENIRNAVKAYKGVGIIHNTIDLMSDFATKGITIHHPSKSWDNFFKLWWKKVKGHDRSERFLNILFKYGNVYVYRSMAKYKSRTKSDIITAAAKKTIDGTKVRPGYIPIGYIFLNPLSVSINKVSANKFTVTVTLADSYIQLLLNGNNNDVLKSLPEEIQKKIKNGEKTFTVDPSEIEYYAYKKDDWELYGAPLVSSILDDISLYKKMRMADRSALDSAVAAIRLWKLGSLEHKILPSKKILKKLEDTLAARAAGGSMDIVWGPDIDFKETSFDAHKFLGQSKYEPVLSAIYAGLGIPPTLTGMSDKMGGFNNNFISLKTMIERLQYGRSLLMQFWSKEVEIIQKALGIRKPPAFRFEHMLVVDEETEKKLLIELAERNVISYKTLRERFNEINEIEEIRLREEHKAIEQGELPPKTGPFLPQPPLPESVADNAEPKQQSGKPDKENASPGRPPGSKDEEPRKQRRDKAQTSPNTKAVVLDKDNIDKYILADKLQKEVQDVLYPLLLQKYEKQNMRSLNRTELAKFESIKAGVLENIDSNQNINELIVAQAVKKYAQNPKTVYSSLVDDFIKRHKRQPRLDEMRQLINFACLIKWESNDDNL